MTDGQETRCALCGLNRPEPGAAPALAWVRETEKGRVRWLCPPCARAHLRDIEGKLPSDAW